MVESVESYRLKLTRDEIVALLVLVEGSDFLANVEQQLRDIYHGEKEGSRLDR